MLLYLRPFKRVTAKSFQALGLGGRLGTIWAEFRGKAAPLVVREGRVWVQVGLVSAWVGEGLAGVGMVLLCGLRVKEEGRSAGWRCGPLSI